MIANKVKQKLADGQLVIGSFVYVPSSKLTEIISLIGLRMPVMGPLENMDLVGLDLIERIHQYLLEDIADNHRPSDYLSANVRRGDLGQKSGRGFYDWTTRSAPTLVERRDRQIVHQLEYLDELDRDG